MRLRTLRAMILSWVGGPRAFGRNVVSYRTWANGQCVAPGPLLLPHTRTTWHDWHHPGFASITDEQKGGDRD